MYAVYKLYINSSILFSSMSFRLSDLDDTITELKLKISVDPDPFLVELLNRLMIIRENQQVVLVEKAYREKKSSPMGGFRGYGVS